MASRQKSPRILLVRLSAIGDVIHAMPVACALRERFPDAYLAWAVEQRASELIEGHAALDERIVLPRGWLRSPAGVWRLRKQLRSRAFDTAIDVQGLTKSAAVAWLSGAKRRIGMDGRWGREISRWLNNELVDTGGLHAIQRGLMLLEPLGIRSAAVRFDVPLAAADRDAAATLIHRLGLDGGFALVASGAGWPSKLWPVDRYAAVAAYLGRRWDLPSLLIWGNDAELARAEKIVASAEGLRGALSEGHALAGGRDCPAPGLRSVPTRGRCTWPRPPARGASVSTVPGLPRNTAPTVRSTSTYKRPAWKAQRASGGMPPRHTWTPSTCPRSARRATG